MKLEPVFTEKRNANILDIKYFNCGEIAFPAQGSCKQGLS